MTRDDYLRLKSIKNAILSGDYTKSADLVISWINCVKDHSTDYDPSWDNDDPETVLNVWNGYLNGELSEDDVDGFFGKTHRPHGEVVHIRSDAYGDWVIYEDGYKEFLYLGD